MTPFSIAMILLVVFFVGLIYFGQKYQGRHRHH